MSTNDLEETARRRQFEWKELESNFTKLTPGLHRVEIAEILFKDHPLLDMGMDMFVAVRTTENQTMAFAEGMRGVISRHDFRVGCILDARVDRHGKIVEVFWIIQVEA